MKNKIKKISKWLLILSIIGALLVGFMNYRIFKASEGKIFTKEKNIPSAYTGIVLGAFVNKSGKPSWALRDRLDRALWLYRTGKIKRFLLSGDHGQAHYDEVNHMKRYLIRNKVPSSAIFLDHAGFDTYDSMTRANRVFQIDRAIIITQKFHLPRAIYIAQRKGIKAYGFVADQRKYRGSRWYAVREVLAKVKAYLEVNLNLSPKYLGAPIPITGDSRKSYD